MGWKFNPLTGALDYFAAKWGMITGTLADQTDLKSALDAKATTSDLSALSKIDGTRAYTGKVSYSSHPTFSAEAEIVDKKYVDDAIVAGGGYTDEKAQDAVAAAFAAGTQTGIGVTYDDDNNKLSLAVIYGGASGTACQGNDSRLSDARTPVSHSHAESDITNLTTDLGNKVSTSRTVNSKALTSDITLSYTDVGADASGAASTVQGNLTTHAGLTTSAHGGLVASNGAITSATKTKITYDAKGLVTSGADATTADIADSSNKRYITDTQQTSLGVAALTLSGAVKNYVYKFNGTSGVWTDSSTTFTFSCTNFGSAEGTTQLIGINNWRAQSAMTLSASYLNGPPTTATVKMSVNGGTYNTVGSMTGPAYTSGTNSSSAIAYPTVDYYLRFRLDSTDGSDSTIFYDNVGNIYFYNKVYWGTATKASGFSAAEIAALGSNSTTNGWTNSRSINATSGQYLVIAFPSRYTSIHTDGFIFNSVTCPFNSEMTVASVTNANSYAETYKVYTSVNTALGNSTLSLSTSSSLINPLYYGKIAKTSGFTQAEVKALANSTITNDNTQTWNSVTTGAGEYMLFAFPARLPAFTFSVGGFDGGFESPETVLITNVNGYAENYYVWRSTNSNLGATVVTTY